MKQKDKEIIHAIKKGKGDDHKALEELYKHLLPHIAKMVNEGNEKEEDAKDILQEAMLIFYKQVMMNKFNDDTPNGVAGFIYSVARNLWINQIKKKKKFIEINHESIANLRDTSILDQLEFEERNKLAAKLFEQLDEKCKELLRLSISEELSMKEVAEKTGYSNVNAATVATHRCKKYLMDLVKKYKSIYTI